MGLFSRKSRLKSAGAPDFGIMVGDDDDPEEGGPSPFQGELSQLRFVHSQESINLASSGLVPEAWDGGRMLFDLETALAHAHQDLRDRLQIRSQDNIQEEAEDLYEAAGEVAVTQAELERADAEYLRTAALWLKGFDELEDEPQEVIRFNNLRSTPTKLLKWLILAIFVASEFIITGFVFNQALPLDIPFIGYILAIGVMVMLIAVPHYLAQGIKEGITEHHRFDLEDEKLSTSAAANRKRRQAHREERDDAGFKLVSSIVGAVLLALIIPLSYLRATETLTGNKVAWFFTFFFIQLLVSGYFFLREWLDHGAPSANLFRIERHRELTNRKRENAFRDYSDSLDAYFQDSAPVFKAMLDAVRQDAQIIETFYATLHYGRHLQIVNRPDLAVFINGARIPYLGPRSEIEDERGLLYDSVSSSNRALEFSSTRGREWWLDQVDLSARHSSDIQTPGSSEDESSSRPPAGALVDSVAREWLYGYLDENFGIGPYLAPTFEIETSESETKEGEVL